VTGHLSKGFILTTLILGAGVANMNLSLANVALPDISRDLQASQVGTNLVGVGFTLGLAASAERAADEAYRVIAEAQDAGAATVTDVLEAEDARRGARVRAVAARSGLQLARARLVAATGGIR
jgi:hypothetical protein